MKDKDKQDKIEQACNELNPNQSLLFKVLLDHIRALQNNMSAILSHLEQVDTKLDQLNVQVNDLESIVYEDDDDIYTMH